MVIRPVKAAASACWLNLPSRALCRGRKRPRFTGVCLPSASATGA